MRRRAAAPDRDAATRDALGAVAARLRAPSAAGATFRAELRHRLVSGPAPVATARTSRWRRASTAPARPARRLGAAGGALLALGLAGTAVGVGAGRSLPGQPLYAAQTAVEQLQLAAAADPVALGVRHLRLAERRLRDVQALRADRPGAPTGLLVGTLDAMDAQTRQGSDLLLGAGPERQQAAAALRGWSVQQTERVRATDAALPPPARDRAEASLALLASVQARAQAVLTPVPAPAPAEAVTTPTPPVPTSAPPTSPAAPRSPSATASPRAPAPSSPVPARSSARPAPTTARPVPSRPVPSRPVPSRSLPTPPVPPATPSVPAPPTPPSPPAPTLPTPPTPVPT